MKLLNRNLPEEVPEPVPEPDPPGFVPLSAHARGELLSALGKLLDPSMYPTRYQSDFVMSFTAQGKPLLEVVADDQVQPAKNITVTVEAGTQRPKIQRDFEGARWAWPDLVPAETVVEVDEWRVDREGRCWRRGTPWPAGDSPWEEWRPLSRSVIRAIRRSHVGPAGPSQTVAMGLAYRPDDGRMAGTLWDPALVENRDKFVILYTSWHPDDIDLEGVRVDPVSGKVSQVFLLPPDAS